MYDYVVAGEGAAGCVLASRLTSSSDVKVLLLEAGPPDTDPYIHMPVGFYKMTSGPLVWNYKIAPQRHANNREIPFAQGRVLGGGSSINAMVFTRGQPQDFDRWANEDGCAGWSFNDILPYYRKSEDNDRLSGPYHGNGGPLGVSDLISPSELAKAFVRACQEAGIPYNPDFNGPKQEGCGFYQVSQRNGRRSSAVEYLLQGRGRPNLTVQTRCFATKIRIENGRSVGVECRRGSSKQTKFAPAERETLIANGAIGSPKLTAAERMMELGFMPLASLKDRPAVRWVRFQSFSEPLGALAGRWGI
jgi:choline dehydrogenase-like flavoprotein